MRPSCSRGWYSVFRSSRSRRSTPSTMGRARGRSESTPAWVPHAGPLPWGCLSCCSAGAEPAESNPFRRRYALRRRHRPHGSAGRRPADADASIREVLFSFPDESVVHSGPRRVDDDWEGEETTNPYRCSCTASASRYHELDFADTPGGRPPSGGALDARAVHEGPVRAFQIDDLELHSSGCQAAVQARHERRIDHEVSGRRASDGLDGSGQDAEGETARRPALRY